MKGWRTWLAVIMAMAYAVGGYLTGMHDADKMIELAIAAMAVVGIGGKLDKASTMPVANILAKAISPEDAQARAKIVSDALIDEYAAAEAAKKPEEPNV